MFIKEKYRSINQVAEDMSIRIFLKSIPKEWIWRMVTPDYGIDFEIELCENEPHKSDLVVNGEILWIQLKSIQKCKIKNGIIKYPIDKSLLWYSTHCQIPILLVLVDLNTENIYWLHIQKFVNESIKKGKFNWVLNEKHVSLDIDVNTIITDSNSPSFKEWRYIAKHNTVIYNLLIFNCFLHKSRTLINDYISNNNLKESILEDLYSYVEEIVSLPIFANNNYYKKAHAAMNSYLIPLINMVDKTKNDKKVLDTPSAISLIDNLYDFSISWSNELNLINF